MTVVELLSEVKAAQPRLMALLDKRQLRPATVELISFISRDPTVRHAVANWIISALTTDLEGRLEGIMSLLSTLIIERRPNDKPRGSDILFFLAPFLVSQPSMRKLRTRLTALLWCNYQKFADTGLNYDEEIPPPLVDFFVAAAFGHHVAQHELEAWERVARHIIFKPQEPLDDQRQISSVEKD
ncbi:hypothetical protein BKA70DRAFT_735696 [Coprinopsis sp. MPI-PUGE-AT-0042]|nr:hypothetical protein BKA70DRAFT_735696 [Coprinopsis sp. MPI-PUGE-AT-0042]